MKAEPYDRLEYITTGDNVTRRILLVPGGARVDLTHSARKSCKQTSLFIPADPADAERIVLSVDALIRAGAARGDCLPGADAIVLRCRKAGVETAVKLASAEVTRNFVWEGVRKEIEMVSHADLASAIDLREYADSIDAGGGDAADEYDAAIKQFMNWVKSRGARYPIGVFEPRVYVTFNAGSNPNRQIELGISPDQILRHADVTREMARKYLPLAWRHCIGGIAAERRGSIVVVSFPKDDALLWSVSASALDSHLFDQLESDGKPGLAAPNK